MPDIVRSNSVHGICQKTKIDIFAYRSQSSAYPQIVVQLIPEILRVFTFPETSLFARL